MLSGTTHKTWSCGIGKCATWEIFLKRLLALVWSKVVRRTLYVWRAQLVKGGNGPHALALKSTWLQHVRQRHKPPAFGTELIWQA